MTFTNVKMDKILQEEWTKKEIRSKNKVDFNRAIKYMWPEFFELGDCVFLKVENQIDNNNLDCLKSIYGDNTGIEASLNHIHIENVIPEYKSLQRDSFRFALILFELWEAKLKKDFPKKSFVLSLSSIEKEHVLRFYTFRQNEKPWIDVKNIDNYMDAILVNFIECE